MNKEYIIEKLAAKVKLSDEALTEELWRLIRAIKESKETIVSFENVKKNISKIKKDIPKKIKKESLYHENYFPNPTLSLKQTTRFR